jgi:tRNA uridine 5-carboxymethylaminomethyl modification enzyme
LYVNGLSTSLPSPVQLEILRSVKGLEHVRMTRSGYAIEYDYYPPTQLDSSLASRALRGLYFAGQVNGTTGYEEAAAQGVIAGLNAARWVHEKEPVILGRETSYIGVLVDDLVSRGVDEPYRLFTSRSEFRLTVRQENALERLGPIAESLGLLSEIEVETLHWRLASVQAAKALADATSITPVMAAPILEAAGTVPLVHAVRATELARRNKVSLRSLFDAAGVGQDLPAEAVVSAELDIKYSGYFARERLAAERLNSMGGFVLGDDLPYVAMQTLSTEARQKLASRKPGTLAQAASIPGISPSDLQNLVFEVERRRRLEAAELV